MNRYLIGFLTVCASSSSLAQVTIDQFYPATGSQVVATGTTMATFDTPYIFNPYGNNNSVIDVSPSATGNLASASFFDGLSYSGNAIPACAGCSGALAVYLPTLMISDAFTLTSTPGQLIPWSLSLTATPQFISASSNVFDNEIMQSFSVGGGAPVLTGTGLQNACFSNNSVGCGSAGISSPSDVPYVMTFSGMISSGGNLTFSAQTSGASNFVDGPNTSGVSTNFDLDPLLQLIVPQGVTVVSRSGVFPVGQVSAVPEESTFIYLLAGLAACGWFARRAQKSKAKAIHT